MDERDTSAHENNPSRYLSFLSFADRKVGTIDTALNHFGVSFTLLLMAMTVIQVVSRYFFNKPLAAYVDFMEMMLVLMVFSTLAYSQWRGGHIRVELFMTKVLKGGRRYHVVECVCLLLSMVAFGIIAYSSFLGSLFARRVGDATISILMPIWPFKMVVAIGSFALCLRFLVQFMQNLVWAVTGKAEGMQPEVLLGSEAEV